MSAGSTPTGGRVVPEGRLHLADEALTELGQSAAALMAYIEAHDSGGEVKPLARGMLGRHLALTDAVMECIGFHDDMSDADLQRVVLGGRGS